MLQHTFWAKGILQYFFGKRYTVILFWKKVYSDTFLEKGNTVLLFQKKSNTYLINLNLGVRLTFAKKGMAQYVIVYD